ncbi:hypothetical protein AXF42_Ash018876 [Apostasia shenzhenica]|uniref:UBZ4-type domain-containing protein n=1 Tax=Apostasia shenzhenica TaxID=1088818 RepID=A0A2I0B530_9ASPA|nr:hypothetical protein AXF42_Ash018876 [Apostasia shenzhenica]
MLEPKQNFCSSGSVAFGDSAVGIIRKNRQGFLQMLTIESPSEPLCFCNASALTSDGNALASEEDQVGFHEADIGSSFSIRDYVLKSRSKGVVKNWPFSQHCFHRCLDLGIEDILPPFELPNLVRSTGCIKLEEPKQLSDQRLKAKQASKAAKAQMLEAEITIEDAEQPDDDLKESFMPPDSFSSVNSDQIQHQLPRKKLKFDMEAKRGDELKHAVTSSKQTAGLLAGNCRNSHEAFGIQCPISKNTRVLEKDSSSTAVFDIMPAKVCPVCRAFLSTPNTTLNAHMDQCFSSEPGSKQASVNLQKFGVKQRKERLLVDIYATAHNCTLEDLDERNGTNWADYRWMAAGTTTVAERRKSKLPHRNHVDDGNRAVYIDSNGVSLKRLSDFNDAPVLILLGVDVYFL